MTRSDFLAKAIAKHGDRYDYSKVPDSFGANDIVTIICREHGEFNQCARSHYRGSGCPKCARISHNSLMRSNKETFIAKAIKKYGDEFDYSKVNYIDAETKIEIICKKHGSFFQTPHHFLKGHGCPKCGHEQGGETKKMTKEEFLSRAMEVHGEKYDYSESVITKAFEETKIICPIHGEFWQKPIKHLSGQGCPKCGYERNGKRFTLTNDDFIERAKKKYGEKYDYSLVEYKGKGKKVKIICPEHGVFTKSPSTFLRGAECPICKKGKVLAKIRKDKEYFVRKATAVHGDSYSYGNFDYVNWHTKGFVTCPKHGDFLVTPCNHISCKSGCPKCSHFVSKWEQEVHDFIVGLGIECEQTNRSVLNGYEIDIFIPSLNIGIECDGLYWHSDKFIDKTQHLEKTNLANEHGIYLIHVFEDEWLFKRPILESMLRNMFGLIGNRIYARECEIIEVNAHERAMFLNENHIQGNAQSKWNYGLSYNGELVSLMTFGHPRVNLGGKKKDGSYELVRFCNKLNYNVVGGASKLFKHFIDVIHPTDIVSYSDKRWSKGNLYVVLGFEHDHDSPPNYFYVNGLVRLNRFGFRKSMLVNEGYDPNKTEKEIMEDRGYSRIYDCGTMVWKWKDYGA